MCQEQTASGVVYVGCKKMVIIGKLCVESSKIDKQITDGDVA